MKKIERFLHGIPLLWGLGTAIAGLPLTLYNPANFWCWIATYHGRGPLADVFRWAFFYGPLWLTEIVVTTNLMRVFVHVRRITKSSEGHVFGNYNKKRASRSFDIETGMSTDEINGFSSPHHSESEQKQETRPQNNDGKPPRRTSFVKQTVVHLRKSIALGSHTNASKYAQKRRQVANQCFRYAMAFYVTWIPITVRRFYEI